MNTKKLRILIGLLLLCLTASLEATAAIEVFQNKDKYGIKDPGTGKILLKAKYDSIGAFTGNHALIWKKGKCGLIDHKGSLMLDCNYSKILLPEVDRNDKGDKYFWATKDGKNFYKTSKDDNRARPYISLVYGPDKKWYGYPADKHYWEQIEGLGQVRPIDSQFSPEITKLGYGYQLFNRNVYSPSGKKVLENINSVNLNTIGDKRFRELKKSGGGVAAMLDIDTGDLWESAGYPDMYKRRNTAKSEMIKIAKGKIFRAWPLRNNSNIYVIEHPEYKLLGLLKGNKMILPFECDAIYINQLSGKVDGKDINIINFEVPGVSKYSMDDSLFDALNGLGITYLVNVNDNGETYLFNSENEMIAERYRNLRVEDGMLTFYENGEKESMDLAGARNIKGYDKTIRNGMWDLPPGDIVVVRNGKYGLYREYIGEIIPPIYDRMEGKEKYIKVYKGDLEGICDLNGKQILPAKYKYIRPIFNKVAIDKNKFVVTAPSGAEAIVSANGKELVPFGTYDDYDHLFNCDNEKWCSVRKNGKMGILNLTTFKLTVPCLYEPGTEQTSNVSWPNRKIALARSVPGKKIVIDVYKITGGKIASKTFDDHPSEVSWMLYFMEKQLNIDLHLY